MKKVLSIVLAAAVLLSLCTFAVSAAVPAVTIERTLLTESIGAINNYTLYRFRATPIS